MKTAVIQNTPEKIYVVVPANLEYNDEYHYQEGWLKPNNKAYTSLEEAKVGAKEVIKAQFGFYHLGELTPEGEGDWEHDNVPTDIWNIYGDWVDMFGWQYKNFIDWAEANNIEWINMLPFDPYCIQEVTLG